MYTFENAPLWLWAISTTPINHDVRAQLTLPSSQEFYTVRDPYAEADCSLLAAPPERSFQPRGSSPQSSCFPWVRDGAYVGQDDLSPSAEQRDSAVVVGGVDDAQEEGDLGPVYLAFGPGEPCRGGLDLG